jgi:hypothetical protein
LWQGLESKAPTAEITGAWMKVPAYMWQTAAKLAYVPSVAESPLPREALSEGRQPCVEKQQRGSPVLIQAPESYTEHLKHKEGR